MRKVENYIPVNVIAEEHEFVFFPLPWADTAERVRVFEEYGELKIDESMQFIFIFYSHCLSNRRTLE